MRREAVKKIGLWILVMALIAAHLFFRSQAHADMGGWKEIYTRTGDCRISFPALPQMIEQKLKLNNEGLHLSYDVYLAPYREHAVCLLLVAQYPKDLPTGAEATGLEGLVNGILNQHPENKLVFADMMKLHGFPAINFLVQSGKNCFRAQAVMIGNRLYMIAMEGTRQDFEEATFQRFLKSFKLAPQKP
ncbi:MAG: hypothetical protein HW387_1560 [Parachlamydiales bacterium]|nr:hypothetical protein [Parachlamydiales bacterium]